MGHGLIEEGLAHVEMQKQVVTNSTYNFVPCNMLLFFSFPDYLNGYLKQFGNLDPMDQV